VYVIGSSLFVTVVCYRTILFVVVACALVLLGPRSVVENAKKLYLALMWLSIELQVVYGIIALSALGMRVMRLRRRLS
jgi:hypothetical protein